MKIIVSVIAIAIAIAAIAGSAGAAARADFIGWCEDDVPAGTNTLAAGAPEIAAHRRFTLPEVHYKGRLTLSGGFDMWLQIDPRGRIACFDHFGPLERPFAFTEEREAVMRSAARWRYTPFLTDGKQARALIVEHISEDVDATRTPMPVGRLFDTRIKLEYSAYQVEIKGDGQVRFEGNEYSDVQGRHTYAISPGEVAALVERLRSRDLWSMRDSYSAMLTHGSTTLMTVTVGGQTKVVRDYWGEKGGMPEEVGLMQADIAATARADGLVTLNADGLKILDGEGFAFAGKPGADLLVRVIQNESVPDDIAASVLDRGAPLTGGDKPRSRGDYAKIRPMRAALDAALMSRRDGLVPRLIAGGALLSNGVPDQARIDSAFQSAIFGGNLTFVETLAAYHPSLSYADVDEHDDEAAAVIAPVSLLAFGGEWHEGKLRDDFAIMRFLIGLGCDINGKGAHGRTLLMIAARQESPDPVRWLLDHGADVRVIDDDGETALNWVYDEDIALALLEAGADPAVGPKSGGTFFYYAQSYRWTRVIAWLEGHGYGEQLKANAPGVVRGVAVPQS